MRLQSSTLFLGASLASLFLLSGCAKNSIVQDIAPPPNPFAYQKVSSLCKVEPLVTAPDGKISVAMTAGSDDGHCALSVSKGGGGSYLSFGVDPVPEHGKAFLYNYNNRTYINYTPVSAYKGKDSFGVVLIPEKGQPRRFLTVDATVEVVGSPAPAPTNENANANAAEQQAAKAPEKTEASSARVHKSASHKVIRHSKAKK